MPMQPRPRWRVCMKSPTFEAVNLQSLINRSGSKLIDADQGLLGFTDIADAAGGDSEVARLRDKSFAIVFRHGDEQSAGGLRIEEQGFEVGADLGFVTDDAFGEVAV